VSAENLEVVRGFLATMSASPAQIQESAAEFWDAEADYYPARKFPEAQPCHGREEAAQFLARYREPWSTYECDIRDLFDVDDVRALAHMSLHAEGRESGVKLETDFYECFWFRNGRFLRVEDHLTLKGALRALGLNAESLEAAGLRALTNLELVRSMYGAFERGDWSSADWADPEIEYAIADGPAPGSWRGLNGLAEAWRSFLAVWEDYRVEVDEYRELDSERVLVLFRRSGRGKTSGLELGQVAARGASLLHIHDGKVTKAVTYMDREHALTGLGLASEAGSSAL
jgi:ketosteroid isomerase-like protein